MLNKLTVILFIILCFIVGSILVVLPWVQPLKLSYLFGLGDWGDNYFLVSLARITGSQSLQKAVASGWVRGAVTGLGVVNLLIAVSEIFNFRRSVRELDMDTARHTSKGDNHTANEIQSH
ncbi:MAG: hypothetical protein MSG64_17400 [Pyrinomonadaceae bacterium MAG19_C2-C3]|nr:hypothetical protein [Pyrinomonadaceae bacterium MAG19_C2-C3]